MVGSKGDGRNRDEYAKFLVPQKRAGFAVVWLHYYAPQSVCRCTLHKVLLLLGGSGRTCRVQGCAGYRSQLVRYILARLAVPLHSREPPPHTFGDGSFYRPPRLPRRQPPRYRATAAAAAGAAAAVGNTAARLLCLDRTGNSFRQRARRLQANPSKNLFTPQPGTRPTERPGATSG